MTQFSYTAIDRQGQSASGLVPAESRAAAMDAVMRLGLTPVEINEGSVAAAAAAMASSGKPVKVPQKAVEAFTRELATR